MSDTPVDSIVRAFRRLNVGFHNTRINMRAFSETMERFYARQDERRRLRKNLIWALIQCRYDLNDPYEVRLWFAARAKEDYRTAERWSVTP